MENDSRLAVCVNQQTVGELFEEGDSYFFRYGKAVPQGNFISLTMPVRKHDYQHSQLHPVFEMHLPEGYLLSVIKRHFTKLVPTDDLGLLRLLAGNVRGRLHYAMPAASLGALHLEDLLHPKQDNLFDELVGRFALHSPLSGVQPKVLAQITNKATLQLDDYIVKAWGAEHPQLALNEYWCMRVVQAAGIAVPEFYLSDDAALFIMKRFDISDAGVALGFEDMCVLQARGRDDKYEGSYEQLAKTIKTFVSPGNKVAAMEQFFKMLVLNQYLQNGDAHLKNFGLLYDNIKNIQLAPAFDVVSTTAYIKNDMQALTLMGSRKWWPRKHMVTFAQQVCDLSKSQANNLYDECLAAMGEMAAEIEAALDKTANEDQQWLLEHLLQRLVVSA